MGVINKITHMIRTTMPLLKQFRGVTTHPKRKLFSAINNDGVIYHHPNSDFMAVRMRADHIPLVVPVVKEFIAKHSRERNTSTRNIEHFLAKMAKDPISYFLINENFGKRADAVFLQEIVSKRNPIIHTEGSTQTDFLKHSIYSLENAENLFFSRNPHIQKCLHTKMTFSSSIIKRKGLEDLMTLIGVTENSEVNAPIHDVTHCMGVTTSRRYVGGLKT